MAYKCLDCEEVRKCIISEFGGVGYVCNLAGENNVDLLEFNGEYMSQRIYNVGSEGVCEFEDNTITSALDDIV